MCPLVTIDKVSSWPQVQVGQREIQSVWCGREEKPKNLNVTDEEGVGREVVNVKAIKAIKERLVLHWNKADDIPRARPSS